MGALRVAVTLAFCGFLVAGGLAAPNVNHVRGRLLYENHCQVCHDSTAHVREARSARSLGGISYQVVRWQRELGLGWVAEDVNDVVHYLNGRYYHFEPTLR